MPRLFLFYKAFPAFFAINENRKAMKEQIIKRGGDKMSKNKIQGIVFGIIMSYAMAYGMEVYNIAIKEGVDLTAGGFSNMTNLILWEALKEAAFMGVLVFLLSSFLGNRMGAAFAARHCDLQKDNPYICRLLRQAGTVAVMCPIMSLAAPFAHWVCEKMFG